MSFFFFGLGGILIPLFASPYIKLVGKTPNQRQSMARKLVHQTFYCFVQFMALMGILTWDIKGIEKLQRRRLLIIANHPTLLDVVFLVAFVPHADCIVKGRLRSNPAMASFIKLVGYIGNDSGSELIEESDVSLEEGSALIIFPEGTRTKNDRSFQFKRGAANVALRTATNLTPVVIHCSPATLSKQHKWYHIPQKKFHLRFVVENDIDIAPYADYQSSKAARVLTRDLENYFSEELNKYE